MEDVHAINALLRKQEKKNGFPKRPFYMGEAGFENQPDAMVDALNKMFQLVRSGDLSMAITWEATDATGFALFNPSGSLTQTGLNVMKNINESLYTGINDRGIINHDGRNMHLFEIYGSFHLLQGVALACPHKRLNWVYVIYSSFDQFNVLLEPDQNISGCRFMVGDMFGRKGFVTPPMR